MTIVRKKTLPTAVIFDLDGTLVDTVEDIAAALNIVLREEGIAGFSAAAVRRLMGHGASGLVRGAMAAGGIDCGPQRLDLLAARFTAVYSRDPVAATRCFPGAHAMLARLRGMGLAVGLCTNKPEAPTLAILERLGLTAYIDAVVTADSGHGKKPDPRPLVACAAMLGAAAGAIVYVGDHSVDVATARAMGVPVIAVAYGYSVQPASQLGADRTITRLAELPDALAGLV